MSSSTDDDSDGFSFDNIVKVEEKPSPKKSAENMREASSTGQGAYNRGERKQKIGFTGLGGSFSSKGGFLSSSGGKSDPQKTAALAKTFLTKGYSGKGNAQNTNNSASRITNTLGSSRFSFGKSDESPEKSESTGNLSGIKMFPGSIGQGGRQANSGSPADGIMGSNIKIFGQGGGTSRFNITAPAERDEGAAKPLSGLGRFTKGGNKAESGHGFMFGGRFGSQTTRGLGLRRLVPEEGSKNSKSFSRSNQNSGQDRRATEKQETSSNDGEKSRQLFGNTFQGMARSGGLRIGRGLSGNQNQSREGAEDGAGKKGAAKAGFESRMRTGSDKQPISSGIRFTGTPGSQDSDKHGGEPGRITLQIFDSGSEKTTDRRASKVSDSGSKQPSEKASDGASKPASTKVPDAAVKPITAETIKVYDPTKQPSEKASDGASKPASTRVPDAAVKPVTADKVTIKVYDPTKQPSEKAADSASKPATTKVSDPTTKPATADKVTIEVSDAASNTGTAGKRPVTKPAEPTSTQTLGRTFVKSQGVGSRKPLAAASRSSVNKQAGIGARQTIEKNSSESGSRHTVGKPSVKAADSSSSRITAPKPRAVKEKVIPKIVFSLDKTGASAASSGAKSKVISKTKQNTTQIGDLKRVKRVTAPSRSREDQNRRSTLSRQAPERALDSGTGKREKDEDDAPSKIPLFPTDFLENLVPGKFTEKDYKFIQEMLDKWNQAAKKE